ncbi:MAG: UDP-N-acetylmuramoyl-L-alanine--D-glutamate ligase [Chloroflexi bacterium]|nr:UDP-N-acetylmuramoyl-L-alanine--D-glutamate ligase [Chloroflexota bacterium]
MGLGVHGGGVGVARFLARQGAQVTVTDLKTADELDASLAALAGLPIRYVLGEHREADVLASDLVIRNPAVPDDNPFLQLAREHAIPIEMEMGLFFRLCPAPVMGVTGTKGKTTTTLLAGAMLSELPAAKAREKDARVVIAGNLRVSALELLDQIDATTPVVLELSSWQIEGIAPHRLSPHIAVITNIYPDHLNRYAGMTEYAAAKALIFQHQKPDDVVILNADQPISQQFAAQAASRVVWFSRTRVVEGLYLSGGNVVMKQGSQVTHIAARADVQLPGDHNLENVLAACAAALAAGVEPEQIARALAGFRGVPHRLELICERAGVRYINDTTSTTPAAAIAALKALSLPAPGAAHTIILIAGGADKALDYEAMGRSVALRTKAVLLLDGSATPKLDAMIRYAGGGPKIAGTFGSMAEVVQRASELAQPGDTVLLSPGCASFGLFANEFDRGDQFRAVVQSLTET